ncbi:RidA family protein [Pseudoxanthomonas sp.]|uniref:RidA family protein n=1 Tax=Pseudoxanthomonas sp. TaxID=1871049 RepID=UPI002613F932|nr:RidA family protein [Pseudoxanthomonas sp.]WDS35029.1 MAG: RidA family protein [Pseudoxanthomonas sp.]
MTPVPEYLNPATLKPPPATYSHLSRAGYLVFLAGQAGSDAEGRLGVDVASQARQVFENLRLALESQGLGLRHLLRITIYLVDSALVLPFEAEMADLMPRLFPDGRYPPSTLLVVHALARPALLVEIDGVALG